MTSLLYREDIDEVRQRLTTWWNGGDIGRPVLLITVPREEPVEVIAPLPEPEGWCTHYSTSSFEYRVNQAARWCVDRHYLGEAVPDVSPDLAPNCLALYLGCQGVEQPGTVWCEPCMQSPEEARFVYDADNFYWTFTLRLAREQLRLGKGKFLTSFPDFIEGLDTLAAMRGSQELLMDLHERPDWVHACLRQITDRYFHYYDIVYNLIRDEAGGSVFWAWAPGRMAKFQCDFAAMIGPDMFGEFMFPVLTEMCERVAHCMFHWDGPGAIPHHDHLLAVPGLDMIQWTPGAGVEPPENKRWWPLYHKTIDAGKKVYVHSCATIDDLEAMKREFGPKLNQMMLEVHPESLRQAQDFISVASG